MALWLPGVAKFLLAAQAVAATVTGTVRDAVSDEPLAGAVVYLTDLERSAVADAQGRYLLGDVPAGPQHLVVRRIGYTARMLHALVPPQGTVEIHIVLRSEPITLEAIEARFVPSLPVRGLDDGDSTTFPDRGLSLAAVRHHPLLAEPDVLQALGGGEVALRPESPDGIHVRSGASDQIAYLLDGIPVFSPYHAAGMFSAWNPDALSRVQLATSSPASGYPDALSGVVSATSRTPGSQLGMQGSIATTQARLTIDGPLGRSGAGYLLSVRSGFPGVPAPKREPSYLRTESGDWLAKLESPLLRGRAHILGYASENEIDAAASEIGGRRNAFAWHSRSVGGQWTRQLGRVGVLVRAWSAVADARAVWNGQDSAPELLAAERRDHGMLATIELAGDRKSTLAGVRTQWSLTSYRVRRAPGEGPSFDLIARTPVVITFVRHERSIASDTRLELGFGGAMAAGDVHLGPRAQLRWQPWGPLSLSGTYARLHQFAQSLRNTESVVGNVFPVDLYVGAGSLGIPVARSDEGIVGVQYRPTAGVRLGAQAYARDFDGLALVAPLDADPFATSGVVVGSGEARGVSIEAAVHGTRYGLVASYGLQDVRLEWGDTSYVPDHGATHTIDAGAIAFPAATLSVRLGASAALGRRTTGVEGAFEWEACNLLDQGCEFAGSPRSRPGALGATPLPAYLRVDLGVRKHWHIKVAGRDGLVAVFGTVTNVFGRTNVLTVAVDPATGERRDIEMRPRAPLVVGLDWRF